MAKFIAIILMALFVIAASFAIFGAKGIGLIFIGLALITWTSSLMLAVIFGVLGIMMLLVLPGKK